MSCAYTQCSKCGKVVSDEIEDDHECLLVERPARKESGVKVMHYGNEWTCHGCFLLVTLSPPGVNVHIPWRGDETPPKASWWNREEPAWADFNEWCNDVLQPNISVERP